MTHHDQCAFVLVHGGSHGGWCWDRLTPLLDGETVVVDLPGRDGDPSGFRAISYDDWVRSAVDQARQAGPGRLVLVGHSLAGIILPAMAAQLRDRVAALVFVSAAIPAEGTAAADLLGVRDLIADDGGFHPPGLEVLSQTICSDLGAEDSAFVLQRLVPDPSGPWLHPVSRSGMPPVPRHYVRLTRDQAVPFQLQSEMIANLGGAEEHLVNAGHSAMINRPEELALVLNGIRSGLTALR